MLALLFQKNNTEAKTLIGNSLLIIYKKVNKDTEVKLLPVKCLERKVTYHKMRYPLASLKKASKKEIFNNTSALDNEPTGVGKTTVTNAAGGAVDIDSESEQVSMKPQVTVTLKLGDEKGDTIDKIKGEYRHNEK